MEFDVSRLRRGELIAGGGAVVLLVCLFLLPWYGIKAPFGPTAATLPGAHRSVDGWHGLAHLRWLVLVTIVLALALVWRQAAGRAPALPVSISVILTVVGLLNLVALIYRVLINVPGSDSLVERKPGGFIGLVAAIAVLYGAYRSLREEGLSPGDARTEVETVHLGRPSTPDSPRAAS
jgi:hypothetical protein